MAARERRGRNNLGATSAVSAARRSDRSLDVTVGSELLEIRPQIVGLLRVLDAGKRHLGAGYHGLRGLDVFLESLFVPSDSRILVGVAVTKSFNRAGLAAVEPILRRADLVLRARTD